MVISCKCSHQLTEAVQSMFTYSMYRRLQKKGGGDQHQHPYGNLRREPREFVLE